MAKKFPEKVSARMIRIIDQGEVYLIRHSTQQVMDAMNMVSVTNMNPG